MRRHEVEAYASPENLFDLPHYSAPDKYVCSDDEGQDLGGSANHCSESEGSGDPKFPEGDADSDGSVGAFMHARRREGAQETPLATHCGEMPFGRRLEDFHAPPRKIHVRNLEGRYLQDFASQTQECLPHSDDHEPTEVVENSFHVPVSDALAAAERQKDFLKSVDKFCVEPNELFSKSVDKFDGNADVETKTSRGKKNDFDRALAFAITKLGTSQDVSATIVMESAFFLIQQGLLNIPEVGTVNVKQARAFLWNAAWLQEHMSATWREKGLLAPETAGPRKQAFKEFSLVIMGPGGTGKTAVLKISEALTVFFAGAESVRKLAPSNAAARLLGGDTLHALCKLPFGKARLTSKMGRLAKPALELHRKRWRTAISAYLDEVSMIAANQLLQCDVRMRQAKMKPESRFGTLAVNLCGDFLQLPPVSKDKTRKSLTVPVDDEGLCDEDEEDAADGALVAPTSKEKQIEGRQGFELWRSIRRVVCLTVNVRAPGVLARLQAEMRDGHISDSMWQLYTSRIMTPGDPRLTETSSPFCKHNVQFIVHRHMIRVMRSLDNAREHCRRERVPLYFASQR